MTREERVKICETCKHCQKDIERGILCGLTERETTSKNSRQTNYC